jgi:hypothetical protein
LKILDSSAGRATRTLLTTLYYFRSSSRFAVKILVTAQTS